MTLGARLRYALWRATRSKRTASFKMTDGAVICLRPRPADDLDTAYEVYALEVYKPPFPLPRETIKTVVDLGANVGLSCVYWARVFPHARIVAFEPHPEHVALTRELLQRNRISDRVELRPFAAASTDGTGVLTNDGVRSALSGGDGGATDGIPVRKRDFFDEVAGVQIDVLKIDIEGGEYEILSDQRFGRLNANVVVLEWHTTRDHPDAPEWCEQRLVAAGYQTQPGAYSCANNGFVWGRRQAQPSVVPA